MDLEHSFTVPVPRKRAWDLLLDVEQVAPCMPGATIDSVDGDEVRGKIKVKVGPISMVYAGTARFTEKDAEAFVMRLEASGKETKGAGTAAASVRSVLTEEGDQTRVTVFTTLNVTGRPAQFGRGMLADIGGRLIGMFAANLAAMVGELGAAAPASDAAAGTAEAEAAGADAEAGPDVPIADLQLGARVAARLDAAGLRTARQLAATTEQQLLAMDGIGPATVKDISARLAEHGLQLGEPAGAGAGGTAALPAGTTPAGADQAAAPGAHHVPHADEALNLIRVAGMPLLKRALPVLAGLVAASLIALRKRLRRGSRSR